MAYFHFEIREYQMFTAPNPAALPCWETVSLAWASDGMCPGILVRQSRFWTRLRLLFRALIYLFRTGQIQQGKRLTLEGKT
jgi:hypothetical protein